jgi:competence protein ComEA
VEQWLERYRGIFLFLLVVLVLAAVVVLQLFRPRPSPILVNTATPQPAPAATATPQPVQVYVSGAVHVPDVYTLPPNSIVKDAILAAGGATQEADLDRINLALPVGSGQHIYVPHLGEENLPVELPVRGPEGTLSDDKIDLNTASQETLESLPGIGPAIAGRIIDYRQTQGPFERIEDVMNVSGIGPATFAKIQELITTK